MKTAMDVNSLASVNVLPFQALAFNIDFKFVEDKLDPDGRIVVLEMGDGLVQGNVAYEHLYGTHMLVPIIQELVKERHVYLIVDDEMQYFLKVKTLAAHTNLTVIPNIIDFITAVKAGEYPQLEQGIVVNFHSSETKVEQISHSNLQTILHSLGKQVPVLSGQTLFYAADRIKYLLYTLLPEAHIPATKIIRKTELGTVIADVMKWKTDKVIIKPVDQQNSDGVIAIAIEKLTEFFKLMQGERSNYQPLSEQEFNACNYWTTTNASLFCLIQPCLSSQLIKVNNKTYDATGRLSGIAFYDKGEVHIVPVGEFWKFPDPIEGEQITSAAIVTVPYAAIGNIGQHCARIEDDKKSIIYEQLNKLFVPTLEKFFCLSLLEHLHNEFSEIKENNINFLYSTECAYIR